MENLKRRILLDCNWNDEMFNDPGSAIVEARLKRRLNQSELAALAGVDAGDLCRYENGEKLPSLKYLLKLADSLHMNLRIQFIPKRVNM